MTALSRDTVSPDLRTTLQALKLGQMLDTLPDRLTLARQQNMTHADFLQLVLADEVTRREAKSASLRARAAGLDAGMRLDTWDESAAVRYDRQLWNELVSLRFLDAARTAPSSSARSASGKRTWPAPSGTSPSGGGAPCTMAPAAKLFKRLKAARLDNTLDAEMRRLTSIDLLHPRRLRASAAGRHRDRRLLPDLRRTPPQGRHDRDLQPHCRGMAGHDGRPAARPVRRRPAHLHLPTSWSSKASPTGAASGRVCPSHTETPGESRRRISLQPRPGPRPLPRAPVLRHHRLPPFPLPQPHPPHRRQARPAPHVLLTRLPHCRAPAATQMTATAQARPSRPRRLTRRTENTMISHDRRWSLPRGNTPVPSRWQATLTGPLPSLCGLMA